MLQMYTEITLLYITKQEQFGAAAALYVYSLTPKPKSLLTQLKAGLITRRSLNRSQKLLRYMFAVLRCDYRFFLVTIWRSSWCWVDQLL
jgi:hypothetical protein